MEKVRICVICREPFFSSGNRAKYCSVRCRLAAQSTRKTRMGRPLFKTVPDSKAGVSRAA